MTNETPSDNYANTLKIYKIKLQDRKAKIDLCGIYCDLPIILKEHPELQQDVFDVWNTALEHPKNDRYSLEDTYSYLTDIVNDDKNMAPMVFNIYKKALGLKKDDHLSLHQAQETFFAISKANPSLKGESAQIFCEALDAYESTITPPKKGLKRLIYRLNDLGQDAEKREAIKEMRQNVEKFVKPNTPPANHSPKSR